MAISLKQSQALNDLAGELYDYLPNKPHPYADQSISFAGIAHDLGLAKFHGGGSKRPAIAMLLTRTLEHEPKSFCPLVAEIVKRTLVYRSNRGDPLQREDIERVNACVAEVGFRIPELWDVGFLESLPRRTPPPVPKPTISPKALNELKAELMAIGELAVRQRGPAFERVLQALFREFELDPRGSIRRAGEQIDGSFDLDNHTYLLEAKFHSPPVGPVHLRVFRDKVEAKASWSRGLFISWSGFSSDAAEALARGKSTSIIGMSGQDLFFVLEGKITLQRAIRRKARRAAETGEALVPIQHLLLEKS